ncbi:MAG TPA: SDR family oxidoreductase [Chryseosolibacter sp.]
MAGKVVSILGCGWLGKALGRTLVNRGYLVNGSTTREENLIILSGEGITPFLVNVEELSEDRAVPFFNADVLIISLPQRARAGKSEEYIHHIRRVMKAAHRGNVKQVILVSTTSVYPDMNRVVSEEDADAQNPIVVAENIVRQSNIPATILRFAGLFGPGRHPGKFLAGKTDVKGGDAPVNLIHLDDCIGIISLIIEQNCWNQVFNACADDHPTRRAFYTKAAVDLGLQPPVFSGDSSIPYKIVSNTRLKTALAYSFRHQLI